jgi:hypothetical protein
LTNAINLPDTIAVVDPVTLTTSSGEAKSTTFTAVNGTLLGAVFTPADQTVGADTTLDVAITLGNKIPRRGLVNIGVKEAWN